MDATFNDFKISKSLLKLSHIFLKIAGSNVNFQSNLETLVLFLLAYFQRINLYKKLLFGFPSVFVNYRNCLKRKSYK